MDRDIIDREELENWFQEELEYQDAVNAYIDGLIASGQIVSLGDDTYEVLER